jgi:hypothetical protein
LDNGRPWRISPFSANRYKISLTRKMKFVIFQAAGTQPDEITPPGKPSSFTMKLCHSRSRWLFSPLDWGRKSKF